MKLLREKDIKLLLKVVETRVEQDGSFADLEDKDLKIQLNYFLFLKKYADDILASNKEIPIEDLLYSQYYWLAKYKNRYLSIVGYDAGLEQQVLKLAEEIDQQIEAGIDWTIIEQIENEMDKCMDMNRYQGY